MFSADLESYPFATNAAYLPQEDRRKEDPGGEYLAHMERRGIDRAILVQAEPYGYDHSLVFDVAARGQGVFGVSTLVPPLEGDPVARLEKLLSESEWVIATRLHAVTGRMRYFPDFGCDPVVELWQAAAANRLAVELHVTGDNLDGLHKLIESHPTPVVIDHLGLPWRSSEDDHKRVLGLSEFDNVYMKISGLRYCLSDFALLEQARGAIRASYDAFGPERLLWGGDVPGIIDAVMGFSTEEERDRVKGLNLQELLRSLRDGRLG